MTRLQELYRNTIVPKLLQDFAYPQVMAVPIIEKICINMGLGAASQNKKLLQSSVDELEMITGQRPIITKSRKGIATFKTRKGWPIGIKVTLRKHRMYEFLDRLISIVLPRIRDFRGFSVNGFDRQGNYNFGIREHIAFAEIDFEHR